MAVEVEEWDGMHTVKEEDLTSFDAVPLCIKICTYSQPTPRNLWANKTFLKVVGTTLEAFRAQPVAATTEADRAAVNARYQQCQLGKKRLMERSETASGGADAKDECVESMCVGVTVHWKTGEKSEGVMMTQWPSEVKERFDGSNKYMKALLECSPYPLCLFNFNGQLITCNPAAKAVFGDTIWLQSDIFGMSERERRGLQARNSTGLQRERSGLEPAEHTERCSAYEAMMEELVEDGSSYQTDLLIRRQSTTTGPEEFWYCRVFAQRHKDPITGEPLIMISHQDVTELRKVEGELGRMQMSANTKQDLMKHDSDVAGSLMVLLGEDWNFMEEHRNEAMLSTDGKSESLTPRSIESTASADSLNMAQRPSHLSGLRACLDKVDEWEFDVFELERESDGLPLQVISWHLFTKHDLVADFQLDQIKFINFLRAIESGHQDNPYHNATHVADVMQSMHCLLTKGGIGQFVGKLEKFAGLFSAIIHDFEHRGFNNDFLIKTVDEWALDSNDKSPNESHHLSAAFRILRQPECNFIHKMPMEQKARFRKFVIEMVMATDMGEHMAIVSKLKSEIQKRLESLDDDIGDDPPEPFRILVMQGAIKVADIGHLYAQLPVHIQWSERLEEEMWRQGDVEQERDMKVSFLMDRDKPGVTKSQPGFIDFVVRPLFETWVACFPQSRVLLDRINANYEYWKSKEKKSPRDDAAK